MSVVVSDSSPLHYLILIGAIDLLPRLFTEVIVPRGVAEELQQPETPAEVHNWIAAPPNWVRIHVCTAVDESLPLGRGEKEAISIAAELHVRSILIDDRKGRRLATQRGFLVVGTLTILEQAHLNGWLNFQATLTKLRTTTNFRIDEPLAQAALARVRSQHGPKS